MSDFYTTLLNEELYRFCDVFYDTANQPLILAERMLSKAEIADIFDTAERHRSNKSKDAYKNKIEPKLKELADKASESQFSKAVAAGGPKAQKAIDLINDRIDKSLAELKKALQDSADRNELVKIAQQAAQIARNNPKTAAFVVGAITTATSLAAGGAAGATVSMLLNGSIEVSKREDFAPEETDSEPEIAEKDSSVYSYAPDNQLNELSMGDISKSVKKFASKAAGAAKKQMFGSDEAISADELEQKWKSEYQMSTDSDDIALLLKDVGFTGMQISKILKNADIDVEDDDANTNVVAVADKIKELGLQKPVSQWIERNYKQLNKMLPECVLVEKKLTDKEVKALFQKVAKLKIKDEESAEESMTEAVHRWSTKIIETATNRAERIMLANRALNMLSNSFGLDDWVTTSTKVLQAIEAPGRVTETLNDGRVVSMEHFEIYKQLIEECELHWNDFLTSPVKIAGLIKFKPAMYVRQSLQENNLGRKRK